MIAEEEERGCYRKTVAELIEEISSAKKRKRVMEKENRENDEEADKSKKDPRENDEEADNSKKDHRANDEKADKSKKDNSLKDEDSDGTQSSGQSCTIKALDESEGGGD